MPIPPGIAFLVPRLPYLLAPPLAVYATGWLLKTHVDIVLPTCTLAIAYIFSWPAALILSECWYQILIARRAAAAGAVMPPTLKTEKPLGIDLVKQVMKDRDNHSNGTCSSRGFSMLPSYLSRCLGYRVTEWCMDYGFTFNARVLLQDRVCASTLKLLIPLTNENG